MTVLGNLLRRNYEPLMLATQVLLDLFVIFLAGYLGYLFDQVVLSAWTEGPRPMRHDYVKLWALTSGVCLVTFHAFGMYRPVKSLLNVEEFKAILKSTVISFLVLYALLVFLFSTNQRGEGGIYGWLIPVHNLLAIDINPFAFSRVTMVLTFVLILILTSVSRFFSFKAIQELHRRGIGNRNAIILGTGETATWLQRKFVLVPTLGLRLVGMLSEDADEVGRRVQRIRVLGTIDDVADIASRYKISEVFVALPESEEERLMEIIARLEELGLTYRVVPRFYHLMSQRVRIETMDSIPLITRADRTQGLLSAMGKRAFDIAFSSAVLLVCAPIFVIAAILVKRESEGPIFFRQVRVGRDGEPFEMLKFRTMYTDLGGDAPKPTSGEDPRITKVGKHLRRYSLDELPQLLNVLKGDMSVVGPRPEMRFIVDTYGPMGRERLRVKPGITGLWQVSYARTEAIHETLDYDMYYVENHSLLLDVVIISLTVPAVLRGTGAV
jgi:exopolysaccharide biosynthesis polyprenyl glycosylphosphotransferase